MKRMITVQNWFAAGLLLGALALAVLSPVMAMMTLAAAHGSAAERGMALAGRLLAAAFSLGLVALAIDAVHLALRRSGQ